ncbi:TadE/TadG family type IV pilus assembly protein [Alloscardovia omnicolens]|uniref:TadE/TadG family type IV pilus assembly protein n=1 Tax=Alloscardovia omnicolens TaxID=419015 RepID=UPI003A6406AE
MRCLLHKANRVIRAAYRRVTRAATAYDAGVVTAEFAVVFPTVVAIAALVLSMTRIIMVQLDCHDAARQAAYSVIVAQQSGASTAATQQEAVRVAQQAAGSHTAVHLTWNQESFRVNTSCSVATLGRASLPFTVTAQAQGSIHAWQE